MELTTLPGIGEKTERLFQKAGITKVEDLPFYYPVSYIEYPDPVGIADLIPGQKCAVLAQISRRPTFFSKGNKKILTASVKDASGSLIIRYFNMPYKKNQLPLGGIFVFYGTVSDKRGLALTNPEIYTPFDYEEKQKTLQPVYALTKGLTNRMVSQSVKNAFKVLPVPKEYLPDDLIKSCDLIPEEQAIRDIHAPETKEDLIRSRERLAFDEFFLFLLRIRRMKEDRKNLKNHFPLKKSDTIKDAIARLPYTLTDSQMRIFKEIEEDLASDHPMCRLLQGDVGSGKTILAFLAMEMCAEAGLQSVLMAPTEVLAGQHYRNLEQMVKDGILPGIRPVLLTGSVKGKERREVLTGIEDGSYNAVIGTHALFQSGVRYKALALTITDEQHRFGVEQRREIREKGTRPHSIVMSATPIPRTLGIILYGDMDLSILNEMPQNRKPVKSALIGEAKRQSAWRFVRKEIRMGHQAYIVCPMIEESEGLDAEDVLRYAARLKSAMPDVEIGILHGRMRPEEKDAVMEAFREGRTRILVSTTVIEVGVDVANATVMLIENAERFGLATLHQLRGRVGRGADESYCILISPDQREEVRERLDFLCRCKDGMEIASKDLSLRGPGDLLGIRQSGDLAFRIADIFRDTEILKQASNAVETICSTDPGLATEKSSGIRERLSLEIGEKEELITL